MWLLLSAIAAAVPQHPCDAHSPPVDFDPATAAGADLRCADLRGADLSGADLSGADLTGAWLHGADLSGADLSGAALRFAYLEGASLRGADLSAASLRRAVLRGADLWDANLDEADLCWVDLTNPLYLSTASTDGTTYCRSSVRPEELRRPEHFGWRFRPFFREPRRNLVSVVALDGISLIQYVDGLTGRSEPTNSLMLFDSSGATFGFDVIGLELVPPWFDATHRHWLSSMGLTAGLGFGASQRGGDAFSFVTVRTGLFARPLSFAQVEGGVATGFTLADDFDDRFDASLYFGVRINVKPLVEFVDDLAEVIF